MIPYFAAVHVCRCNSRQVWLQELALRLYWCCCLPVLSILHYSTEHRRPIITLVQWKQSRFLETNFEWVLESLTFFNVPTQSWLQALARAKVQREFPLSSWLWDLNGGVPKSTDINLNLLAVENARDPPAAQTDLFPFAGATGWSAASCDLIHLTSSEPSEVRSAALARQAVWLWLMEPLNPQRVHFHVLIPLEQARDFTSHEVFQEEAQTVWKYRTSCTPTFY